MVWCAFGSGNRRAPFHNIVGMGTSATVGGRIFDKFGEFFLDAFGDAHIFGRRLIRVDMRLYFLVYVYIEYFVYQFS